MTPPLPPLEITKENWRKTGIRSGGGSAGKTDRIPATGMNLEARRRGYEHIDWKQRYCGACLRSPQDCTCPQGPTAP